MHSLNFIIQKLLGIFHIPLTLVFLLLFLSLFFFFTNTLKSSRGVNNEFVVWKRSFTCRIETRSNLRYEGMKDILRYSSWNQMNTWNDRYIQRNNVRGTVQREIVCSNSSFLLISSFRLDERSTFVRFLCASNYSLDCDICTFFSSYTFCFVYFGIIYNFYFIAYSIKKKEMLYNSISISIILLLYFGIFFSKIRSIVALLLIIIANIFASLLIHSKKIFEKKKKKKRRLLGGGVVV